ncbi:MAG: tryptophan--tRNA ligase [Candidatus Omnitrophica bacterium]|nr:tryptophan--tRNA ligase [Candidatus Omnitrophota bacterium]MDD5351871.1 tryptophan--tRNA ligase [Candidatus Omnitrophota bacterium]MDD5550697.1 tryptophan--tRNA ligase [Candidatus Omnitrophota bacterium]
MKKTVLSGMRPTGKLHLGHLVGALNNWLKLQKEYQCFFMVADWHALMSEYKSPSGISNFAVDNVIDWLSCGIDPESSVIFVQSQVKEHLELYMVLSCLVPLGWLERCPTYKEQKKELKAKDISNYAFLGYPVLQAADILLYKADCVPVGEDQLPHLEICREIVRRFKSLYKKDVFVEPQALLTKVPRLLGIDGRKMSKSYDNTIALSDSPEMITKKVSSMFTDPKRIKRTDVGHPKQCNVYNYYEVFKPELKDEVYNWCTKAELGCTECKQKLAGILIEQLSPIQQKRAHFESHKDLVTDILRDGQKQAAEFAANTMKEVKEALGNGLL